VETAQVAQLLKAIDQLVAMLTLLKGDLERLDPLAADKIKKNRGSWDAH
jgi:hypothetical protein